ncbi:hypothetical protein DFJ58DRAFT_665394, partial [Suillus subalutaceus]|uniref:uncharacterized protein n=1 Tax=Suillus subalutaceus TaxID=48586 RepID=UPI001B86C0D4
RGLVICACGSTGRVAESAMLLRRIVESDIFDFILTFAGVSTMDSVVVPALNRFIENVYIYDMKFWDALEESFGEDRHALNQSPVFLSFSETHVGQNNVRLRVVYTRVLAYSNLKDRRPWGLDIYRCLNPDCQAPAYNMSFTRHGKQFYGKHWLTTKIKYACLECKNRGEGHSMSKLDTRGSVSELWSVWYEWPLTSEQEREIGIIS